MCVHAVDAKGNLVLGLGHELHPKLDARSYDEHRSDMVKKLVLEQLRREPADTEIVVTQLKSNIHDYTQSAAEATERVKATANNLKNSDLNDLKVSARACSGARHAH